MTDAGNHMYELFRRAADHYPLKSGTADWDEVSRKLAEHTPLPVDDGPVSRRGITYAKAVVVVLLLLPLATGISVQVQQSPVSNLAGSGTTETRQQTRSFPVQTVQSIATGIAYRAPQQMVQLSGPVTVSVQQQQDHGIDDSLMDGVSDAVAKVEHYSSTDATPVLPGAPATAIRVHDGKDAFPEKEGTNVESGVILAGNTMRRNNKLYLGVSTGPDYAVIKGQQLSYPGLNIGVLAGYYINERFSAEIGIVLTHKNYFTEGKYLAPNSIRRDDAEIINVNAYNSITEIPVALRYDISTKPKGKWFAGMGGVSYIIHKERYTYWYDKNGQEKKGTRYNNKSSNNWMSNIQLSMGYERTIRPGLQVRVEPYYRIPVQGIGISDLPVTSFGLKIALLSEPG